MDFRKCFVPFCKNTNINSRKIFIAVPRNEIIRKNWCLAVGRRQILSSTSGGIYCCEDHFNMEQDCENWMQFKMINCPIRMKKDVVPHVNLYVKEPLHEIQLQDSPAKKKQKITKLEELNLQEITVNRPCSHISQSHKTVQVHIKAVVKHKGIQAEIKKETKSSGINTISETTSVATSPFKLPRKLAQKGSSPLISFTGSSSSMESHITSEYEIEESTDSCKPTYSQEFAMGFALKHHISIIRENSRFFLGIPKDVYFLVSLLEKEAKIDHLHIFTVLKKIRLNDPYFRLALDFGISKAQIARIMKKSLPKLAAYFRQLIFWPDGNRIRKNLPIPFRFRYRNVQSIIDCLEIEIEKPSIAIHQALTWSNYKKTNTLKYLISSTPDGMINFISEGFGGRITDKEITEASNFLNVLPNNCEVMADRGFKAIGGILQRKGCNLIRSPSVEHGSLSSRDDIKLSKRIASLRIHIERVIRRLREFAILEGHCCLDHQLVPKADYLITIACGIVNLQGPLIK